MLAGGSGTRFWPLSRRARPKQLLSLDGGPSLLRQALERLEGILEPGAIWISATEELAGSIRRELPEFEEDRILVEPVGRNTAPAIGAALLGLPPEARAGAVAVLPSDHRVASPEAFRRTLGTAFRLVETSDRIVTLGVRPRWAETGFGYLELGAALEGEPEAWEVARFREKPDLETAEQFLTSGRHLWNAGIFVFRGERMLAELRKHAPELARGLERFAAGQTASRAAYEALPAISIDYAVMEKTEGLAAVALDCGWNDLGSWAALYDVLEGDAAGNRSVGDSLFVDATNCLVVSPVGTTAVLGVDDLIVVRTGDSVLVLPRSRSQEVRRVLEALEGAGRNDLL